MTNFKKLRFEAELTQKELSNLSGVELSTIRSYENGQTDILKANFKNVLLLCQKIGCKLSDLSNDERYKELVKSVS